MTFFRSRWVDVPAHVRELDAARRCRPGFRAAGVAAGIKPEGLDVGVVVVGRGRHGLRRPLHDQRARGRAGDSCRGEADLGRLRAVAANSGCSNVGDGPRGVETALGDAGGGRARSSAWSPGRWRWPRPA